jgi:hypothetical protein
MTKRLLLKYTPMLCLFGLLWLGNTTSLFAQPFGNEWINFNQKYFKIPVVATGVYRISQAQLTNAGIVGVNPKKLQIFHRGQEQAIFVSGESDNSLDANDYLEFYGQRNDGTLDYNLYGSAGRQVNPYYNTFSDTTAYFLTWTLDNTLGKRIEDQNLSFKNPISPYHLEESVLFFSDFYDHGQNYRTGTSEQIFLSQYDEGEGWTSATIATNGNFERSFAVQNLYSANNNVTPFVEIVATGEVSEGNASTNPDARYTIEVRAGPTANNLRLIGTIQSFLHFKSYFVRALAATDLGSNCVIRLTVTRGSANIAYIKLTYPQTLTANLNADKLLKIPRNDADTAYYELSNAPANALLYDITDLGSVKRLQTQNVGGKLRFTVADIVDKNRQVLVYANNPLSVLGINEINFVNFNPLNHNYLIISHPILRKPIGNIPDIVQAYANYRASVAGGGYKPLIFNIDELYNQFNYGEKSPLAIRSFADYMYRNGSPKHILLIGRGASLPDRYNPLNIRKNPSHYALDLVPTMGFPPSDIAMVAGLGNQGTPDPSIPIGRIAASKPQHVLSYLNKVIEYEGNDLALWQKTLVHLSGGNTVDEQKTYKQFMINMANLSKSGCIGAQVASASKTTTSPVELVNISGLVNEGVGLVTFFGHSSLTLTDIEIGLASDDLQGYRNKGKYPFMLANGCQLAGIFYDRFTLSQDWTLTPDRGAIAFIAHCYFGYSIPLYEYSLNFYNFVYRDCAWTGRTIGEIMKEHIRRTVSSIDPIKISTAQQMILQGDPALKFYRGDKVDYYTADNQLFLESYDNNPVSAVSDSFKLRVIVSNLGLRNNQAIKVKVKRTYANGLSTEFSDNIGLPPIIYRDTLTFVIRKENALNGYGINRFEVTLDFPNEINEMNENNNIGRLEYFIPSVGVLPLLPLEYSIVNEQPVTLTGLANNLASSNRPIIFEIDTTHLFNSPFKKAQVVEYSQTPSWQVNLLSDNAQDSTVYFWRVNYADAVNDPNVLWGESSFVYIKNSPEGWSQSRFPQFSKSALTNIRRDDPSRKWFFTADKKSIEVKTFGNKNGGNLITDVQMDLDGLPLVFNARCGNNRIIAIAFDQNTGDPYRVFNDNVCGRVPEVANFFDNAALNNNRLNAYLQLVKSGDFVLFFTSGNINFSAWSNANFEAFAQIGGNPTIYRRLQSGHPYIILGRKGFGNGTATEVIAGSLTDPALDAINLNAGINLDFTSGEIVSSKIGPAKKWKEVLNKIVKTTGDTYQLDLYGIDVNQNETSAPLVSNITAGQLNLSTIDAAVYPYLRFKLKTTDATHKTPAQLNKWVVIYDGVPEGLIDPEAVGLSAYNIPKKQEGAEFKLDFAFRNISNLTFSSDSLLVKITQTNLDNFKQTTRNIKIKAPQPKELIRFSTQITTMTWGGKNELKIFVNPPEANVPENFYENNIFSVNFEVIPDKSNPILEVAFDGKKILDGEIVAPNPLISVQLRDDNQYSFLKDYSNLNLAIKHPCESCQFELVDLSKTNWVIENGVLKVDLKLLDLPSGKYALRAQGEDAFGNKAGTEPYLINFEVVRESSVTNFFPYPNPFSTNTRFVFTLTGSEVPDEIKIQILTVSGKVVREITQAELGVIRIGQNLTEYAWDGTDEFGDKLANGVYLYRVVMRQNGKIIEQRATSADKAFKNGLGKLYIAR